MGGIGSGGHNRKPTALKLVQGTYRADRATPNEPTPDVEAPSCPTWLHPEAKREWRRIIPELEALGLIAKIDRAALAAYCQAYAEWWEMERAIAEHGRVQVTESGYVAQRPEVAMRNKALDTMRAFLREFGLTPVSRTRVSVPEKPKTDKGNPFLDALNG